MMVASIIFVVISHQSVDFTIFFTTAVCMVIYLQNSCARVAVALRLQ